jgi:RNA polymerase I-specific transcription initiation factor RRN7
MLTEVVEIYPAVRRLAAILGIDFTYPIPQKRPGYITYPEIQLMSLIVVATKLSHPFDDIVRYPEDDSDPTIVKIDWSKWQDIMIEKSPAGLKRGEEIKVTDEDVLAMSGKKLDDYLDWYQRTWIDSRAPKSPLSLPLSLHWPLTLLTLNSVRGNIGVLPTPRFTTSAS